MFENPRSASTALMEWRIKATENWLYIQHLVTYLTSRCSFTREMEHSRFDSMKAGVVYILIYVSGCDRTSVRGTQQQTLPRLFYYFSLRCRRLEVVGKRENGRARGRHACLLLARPFFLVPTQFQAPATQATITCGGLQMCWWPFHSCSIFEAYVIYSIRFSKV